MKVGIVSPYLQTLGGGERYVFSVAKFFLNHGDSVDFYETGGINPSQIIDRFGINLSKANFFTGSKMTFGYDLFFFLSDGSISFSFAKKNILHFQVPFNLSNQKTPWNKIKLARFSRIVCNSKFTKKYIDQSYGVNSEVLYPPVDTESFRPGKKENIILSVGRFSSPSHPKKQEILISSFKQMGLKNWQLVLAGGGEATDDIKKLAGENIRIIANSSFSMLRDYYAKAKIYWHAAGFGEDLEKNPDRAEHFGISTVEAMSAGCVPIVFAGGGQLEIVNNGKNGFLWKKIEELNNITKKLIGGEKLLRKMSDQAQKDAQKYSQKNFYGQLEKFI